jgi:DinB family protein
MMPAIPLLYAPSGLGQNSIVGLSWDMAYYVTGRPSPSEYGPDLARYVDLVPGDDIIRALTGQIDRTIPALRAVSEEVSLRRYAQGKWSLKEVLGHMIDTERIFAYRALRIARKDKTLLPSFDQDAYVAAAGFDTRAWSDLLMEFELLRRVNVLMFRGLDKSAWELRGNASGNELSVRAAAFVIAGHELAHKQIIREKYIG